jgi:hypothetical protein
MPSYRTSLAAAHEQRQRTKTREEQPWRSWYKSPIWKAIKDIGSVRSQIVEIVRKKGER